MLEIGLFFKDGGGTVSISKGSGFDRVVWEMYIFRATFFLGVDRFGRI